MAPELKKAGTILVSTIGLVAGVLGIYTADARHRLVCSAIVSLVVIGLTVWACSAWFRRKWPKTPNVPPVKEIFELGPYTLKPATSDDIGTIAELEACAYSREDAIPEEILREWHNTSPGGFWLIKDAAGRVAGHIDILPVKPQTLCQFTTGVIKEREIRGESLYNLSEKSRVTDLYVESIIVNTPNRYSRGWAIKCLLANFLRIVGSISEPYKVRYVYAISATEAGSNLLQHLGFSVHVHAEKRSDCHDLYVGRFAVVAESINRLCSDIIKDTDLNVLRQLIDEAEPFASGAVTSQRTNGL